MTFSHSLIITTYNRPDALDLVLRSVCNQSIAPMEVIIADDGSTFETKKVIESYKDLLPQLQHVWQEDDGFRLSMIRNEAIRKSTGVFISMIDGDMVLHHDFLKDIQKHVEPHFYLQGKRVLLSEATTKLVLSERSVEVNFFSKGIVNRFNTLSLPVLSNWISQKFNSIKGVKGCSMHFWKEDAEKVNGFNEAFIGWGREDSEFLHRLLNAGIHRRNIALGAVAYHLYHAESSRDQLATNDDILAKTISLKKVWCEKGLVNNC